MALSPTLRLAAMLWPIPAMAQVPTPEQTPAPVATPTPVPSATPAPVVVATPSVPVEDAAAPVFVPNVRPTPRPTRTPAPITTPTPAATVAPAVAPVLPRAAPSPIETVILPQPRAAPWWPWLVGGVALLLIAGGWLALRRQREDDVADYPDDAPVDDVPPPVVASDRAQLVVTLRPVRAGLNLISATAEAEVTIANAGHAPTGEVRAALRLMSAGGRHEAELAAFFADPHDRPAVPAFALGPGEERTFRAVTALPHDAIDALDAGGRPMFVPLLALSVRYRDPIGWRRLGQAFALGIERADSAKLAPLWLDGPARTYDSVAARPHGGVVEG